jgi:hypothetical protein
MEVANVYDYNIAAQITNVKSFKVQDQQKKNNLENKSFNCFRIKS